METDPPPVWLMLGMLVVLLTLVGCFFTSPFFDEE